MRKLAICAPGLVLLAPVAAAADPLDGLKPTDCGPNGRVDNLVLRDRIIVRQKSRLEPEAGAGPRERLFRILVV